LKKKEILLAVLLVLRAGVIAMEDGGIQEIKKLYAETAAAIARAQQNEAEGLYCNELTINSHDGSWRAVGTYLKKAAFWYSDQPEFAAADGREPESVLAKVEVRETAAVSSLYREFFFTGGRLCFFFRSEKNGDEPAREERVYFKDGKPLLQLLGPKKASAAIDAEPIFAEAQYWQKMFLLSFAN
jgi:hypothetical protein